MEENRFVGTPVAPVATIALGALTIALALMTDTGPWYLFPASIVSGVLTWVALVHCHRSLFKKWMQFAHVLHDVAITTIFGVCYLVIVPLFRLALWFRDPLALRRAAQQTSWVTRTANVDAGSMERMG
jgi:hypothetical protein